MRVRLNLSGIYPLPPLGIAMLASSLQDGGFPVTLLDAAGLRLTDDEIVDFFKRHPVEHVGLSANFFAVDNALRLATLVKEVQPRAFVSLGGPCTLFRPEQILSYTRSVDLVVKGEGEAVVVALLQSLEKGEPPRTIPGTTLVLDGKLEATSPGPLLDMDKLPRPALDLLPLSRYRLHPPFGIYPPSMIMETARGCPFRCTFCSLSKAIRARSAGRVVDDVKDLVRRYHVREIHFVDPTFTFDRERVLEICAGLISAGLDLHWTCKTRCDLVDPELLRAMARSGCYTISYGVESATQRILDALQKDVTVEQNERALVETKRAGIRTLAYLLVGSPGETDETIDAMIAMVRRLEPDFVLYGELHLDPCSKVAEGAIASGQVNEGKLLDYYVGGHKKSIEDPALLGREAGKVEGWLGRASNAFYARPGYIVQRLTDMRTPTDLFNHFHGGWSLLADKLRLTKTFE
jgi:radical SAM superfamily enzyme YgiQ (UPF0313 family)